MGRGYTSDAYVNLTRKLRACRPDLALSSDFITGFCGETEEDHQATLDLVRSVELEYAFVFPYSPREKTRAARHLTDDVPQKIKTQRVQDITKMWRTTSLARNARRSKLQKPPYNVIFSPQIHPLGQRYVRKHTNALVIQRH